MNGILDLQGEAARSPDEGFVMAVREWFLIQVGVIGCYASAAVVSAAFFSFFRRRLAKESAGTATSCDQASKTSGKNTLRDRPTLMTTKDSSYLSSSDLRILLVVVHNGLLSFCASIAWRGATSVESMPSAESYSMVALPTGEFLNYYYTSPLSPAVLEVAYMTCDLSYISLAPLPGTQRRWHGWLVSDLIIHHIAGLVVVQASPIVLLRAGVPVESLRRLALVAGLSGAIYGISQLVGRCLRQRRHGTLLRVILLFVSAGSLLYGRVIFFVIELWVPFKLFVIRRSTQAMLPNLPGSIINQTRLLLSGIRGLHLFGEKVWLEALEVATWHSVVILFCLNVIYLIVCLYRASTLLVNLLLLQLTTVEHWQQRWRCAFRAL